MERALQQLEVALDSRLVKSRGDCVSRSSDSGEIIAVIHADDAEPTWRELQNLVSQFESKSGLRVVGAKATSTSAGESANLVFMRADEALSERKTELRAAA